MSRADRRHLLESVAFGSDPSIRPGDRLRAMEMLDDLGDDGDHPPDFRRDLADLSGEQLDGALDAYLGPEAVADALESGVRFPLMGRLIGRAVEERARQLADRDAIEREIEERAQALAGTLYVERGLDDAERAANAKHERPPREEGSSPEEDIDPSWERLRRWED